MIKIFKYYYFMSNFLYKKVYYLGTYNKTFEAAIAIALKY
jgi:flavin-binding protein dodecin